MTKDELRETTYGDSSVALTIVRLRNRSWMMRIQAYGGILVIVALVFSLIWFFYQLHRTVLQGQSTEQKWREPFDQRLVESRHTAIAERLKEFSVALSDAKQELISDKYGKGGTNVVLVAKLLQTRSEELGSLKTEIEERLVRDRQNTNLEINRLREERDTALREGGERRTLLRLVGDAVLRVGILILAVYLISIISNISKYWLRVADHLNSTADSLDLLRLSGLSLQSAISSLTPHPIDFHVDDVLTFRSIKDMIPFVGGDPSKSASKAG